MFQYHIYANFKSSSGYQLMANPSFVSSEQLRLLEHFWSLGDAAKVEIGIAALNRPYAGKIVMLLQTQSLKRISLDHGFNVISLGTNQWLV